MILGFFSQSSHRQLLSHVSHLRTKVMPRRELRRHVDCFGHLFHIRPFPSDACV